MIRQQVKKKKKPVNVRLKVMQKSPEIRVHYTDLEEFVNQVFSAEFKFLKSAGMTHGMIPEYRVTGDTSGYERRVVQIRNGKIGRNIGLMLNVLCKDNKIPAGDYVIDTYRKPHPTDVYRQLLEDHRNPEHHECRKLKRKHQADKMFSLNASILDQACREIYGKPS